MQKLLWKILAGLICTTSVAFAEVPTYKYGLTWIEPVITKDPQYLHLYRLSAWYQPPSMIWRHMHLYFDLSAGHWWASNNTPNRSLNIIAIAPIFRYYFATTHNFSPFINLSIGLAYLSETRFAKKNLGMHFAFQDQVGIGAAFGESQRFSVTMTAMHYSNGSLCNHNSGITVPIFIGAEYAFG